MRVKLRLDKGTSSVTQDPLTLYEYIGMNDFMNKRSCLYVDYDTH